MTTPREPYVSQDEAMLQDASRDMQIDAPLQPQVADSPSPPSRGGKKALLAIGIIILLVGLGMAGWLFARKNSPTTATVAKKTTNSDTSEVKTQTLLANTIAYAFKATDKDPFSIYSRPAIGGDRKEALVLDKKLIPLSSDVRGQSTVFNTDDGIYTSVDSGKTYKKIINLSAGQQVTSIKFSTTGQHIAYGYLAAADGKNVVKSVDLNGQNPTDLFSSDKAGVYVYAWNEIKNQIAFGEGCYGCDGHPSSYTLRDLKTKTNKDLLGALSKAIIVQSVSVSDDLSKVIYVAANADSGSAALSAGGAPYVVTEYDVSAAKAGFTKSIGTKGEKNPNGTDKYRTILVGFTIGTSKAYYADGATLYTLGDGGPKELVTVDKPILRILYVSDTNLIFGYGAESSDYNLINYGISDKKSTTIFQGDNNTVIFGVTTK